jgi:phage terminase large subunit
MQRLSINPIYHEFFKRAKNEKRMILQGSRRSGKTIAIFQLLEAVAKMGCAKKILCVNPSYPNLQDLQGVFSKVTGIEPQGSLKYGISAKIDNCVFQFRAFDKPTKVQGSEADIVYYNECNLLDETMVDGCNLGIRGKQIYDFNPANRFWIDKFINENNYLKTTWRDNPFLPAYQKQEFLDMEARAEQPDATTRDKYIRDIYCLGIYGTSTGGLIFPNFKVITTREYFDIMANEIVGNDWGASDTSRDPDVFVGTKRLNNCLFIHEYLYSNSMTDYDIAKELDEQLESGTEIVFETATSGIKRVQSINRLTNIGINWRKATKGKGSVLAGIRNLSQYQIYITDMSPNIKREMENYSWVDNDKGELIPQDKFNHAIDAVRYAEEFYLSKYGQQQFQSDLF